MKARFIGLLLLVLSLMYFGALTGQASEKFSVNGYYKSFMVCYELPDIGDSLLSVDLPPLGSVVNRLRINADWRPNDWLSINFAYDLAPTVQDHLLFSYQPTAMTSPAEGYRFDDLKPRLYPDPDDPVASFGLYHNLDRANVTIRLDFADVTIGRQPIAFGSARVINPTDILTPYSYGTLDTEDRLGIDAVRVQAPLGFMGELDAGVVAGDDFDSEESAAYLRAKYYLFRTDVSVIALAFRENLLIGLDMARSVGGAGVWLEAAQVYVNSFADRDQYADDYTRLSAGFDYAFSGESYFFCEYHFNGPGTNKAEEYATNSVQTAYLEGATYLMGKHYLTPGMSYQITPLLTSDVELLTNLSDPSTYLLVSAEYNLAPNVYLTGGMYTGIGRSLSDLLEYRSEFGAYPDLFFSSFRWYW